jgi:hypothetical protein
MEIQYILPVATLIAGWMLGEASQLIRKHNEKVQSLNCALSDLLEIRHRMRGTQYLVSWFAKNLNFPPEVIGILRTQIPDVLKINSELKIRFNKSLDLLSAYDPFLSFYLRSKDSVNELDHYLIEQVKAQPGLGKFTEEMRAHIDQSLLPHLDEAILKTAEQINFVKRIEAEDYLKQTEEPPPDVLEVISKIETLIKKALAQDQIGAEASNLIKADGK